MKTRINATINDTIQLDFNFFIADVPTNLYEFQKVEIYDEDPRINLLAIPVQTILTADITNVGIGQYRYVMSAVLDSKTYFDKRYYRITSALTVTTSVDIVYVRESELKDFKFPLKGFAFNNPDYVANNGWGNIITPDELRYVYAFGNELQAPNVQTITDETLQWYIDNAVSNTEKDFKISILKRLIKYRPQRNEIRTFSGLTEEIDYFWEDPYDFDAKMVQEYIYIKLRKRPVLSIQQVLWRDVAGGEIINLTEWMRPNYEKGSIQFFPVTGSLTSLPLALGISPTFFSVMNARGYYPDSFFIDYTVGFNSVREYRKKWNELTNVIGMLAAVALLNDYGDGRSPGLASSSVSLSGISESFATTQSATNALYGARILQFEKQLREFYKRNKERYCGLQFTSL